MNTHIPQSIETAYELKALTSVPTQIISPATSDPIIQVKEDTLTAAYLMTLPHIRLDKKEVFNLLMTNNSFTGELPKAGEDGKWRGQDMFSMFLPDISFKKNNNSYDVNPVPENTVIVENGEFIQGVLDKSIFGKTIIKMISDSFGNKAVQNFLDNNQRMLTRWLAGHGFTIGMGDCIPTQDNVVQIKDLIESKVKDVNSVVKEANMGTYKQNLDNKFIKMSLEADIQDYLNMAKMDFEKYIRKNIEHQNAIFTTVSAGSKGTYGNITQIRGMVGQNTVAGQRVTFGYERRTLPLFSKDDYGARSRGFVANCFFNGLDPIDYFFHQMGGREGVIDTAIKSVSADTAIIILENNEAKYVKIGDWIDEMMDKRKEEVEHKEQLEQELLNLNVPTYIPTTDDEGNVSWGNVVAVTRHDPGQGMFKITTASGRDVKVVESKSLIVWDNELEKFKEVNTSDVNIGDFLPTNAKLEDAPVILSKVCLTKYFPKTEYVHGKDFNIAVKEYKTMMSGRERASPNWWVENNGKEFTLPYERVSLLNRATKRSFNNLKDGVIYPFRGSRDCGEIPSELELNYENGVFIGLYLSEGNTDFKSGTVKITNINEAVISFTQRWFASFGIKTGIDKKVNNIGANSTSVIGYSRMLTSLLDKVCGKNSHFKFVPDFAFISNEEFIKGVISGYFSGDGCITKNSVNSSSASSRLTEGISMLCNKLGIFGKISLSQAKSNNFGTKNIAPAYRLSIRSEWASIFASKIRLIDTNKIEQLNKIHPTKTHRNFKTFNDVVLDPIVSIERLNVEDYPKVYDITVPSTLNFGLANGLMVRDTAESGYMQRRLIKALEDLTVKYGGTIRNGINNIVQFAYGDDGIDPCKLNKQELKLVEMSDADMKKKFLITEEDYKFLKTILTADAYKQLADYKDFQKIYDDLFEIRNKARKFYFRDMTVMNCVVHSPVLFVRTIHNAKDMFKIQLNKKSDLTPQYVFESFKKLEDELLNYLPEFSINIFRALLLSTLSPKVCLIEHRFNKTVFKFIMDTIREKYLGSLVQPGEMVGVIGAQSMGEPLTQMSVPADTKIIVQHNGAMKRTDIGEFIDDLFKASRGKIVKDKTGKHMIMEIDDDVKIMSVTPDEKNGWKKISKISRHPVNGKLMKVYTRSGRNARATLSHSFLKRTAEGIVPIEGANLKVGDRIPVTLNMPVCEDKMNYVDIGDIKMELTEQFGYFCGLVVMQGEIMKMGVKYHKRLSNTLIDSYVEKISDKYGWTCSVKDSVTTVKSARLGYFFKENFNGSLPAFMFATGGDCVRGFLAAVMDTSATIDTNKMNIRLVSTHKKLVEDISLLFSYINVFATVTEDERTYGSVMSMSISRKYAEKIHNGLHLLNIVKKDAVVDIVNYLKRDDVHDVSEYIDKIPAVGNLIADVGKLLGMPQHTRYYGRWRNKESIGRRTLSKYLDQFRMRQQMENIRGEEVEMKMRLLEQACNSDVVWDEIVRIEQYDGEDDEYVYDFTVPGSESFMVENGVLVHNTLNTFHNAGVGASGVVTTTGVPRIKEIINVAKTIKVPAMEIHLKPQFQDDVNKAKTIANQIEFTKLQDIVEKSMIVYENPNVPTQYEEDLEFAQIYQEFSEIIGVSQCPNEELSHWVLRIVFSKEKMMNKNIFLADIQEVIQRNSVEDDIQCIFTDDNAKEMMMRIIVREDSYDGDYLEFLQELEKELMGITIRGLPNVEKAVPQMMKRLEYREDGSYNQATEWFLATIGVNLLDVLINENVDAKRTMSNDIHEINEIFGIEATRNIILHELMKLDDYPVNYRHISLLGDIMTHRGVIMTIERHGINRSTERGAIAKATFEESTEILVKASTFGERDKMGGVSANIMFGQMPKVGTNAFDLLFDESKFITELKNHKHEYVEKVDTKDLAEQLEQQLGEYGENAGELIEDAFDFSFDKGANPEKQLPPHAFPDASILKKKAKKTKEKEPMKETPIKKKTVVLKKKVTKTV